ncbi:MAG: hypothetical protein ACREHD_28160 [Pirellulales bacterium]
MSTNNTLPSGAQQSFDLRLDAIDRALLGLLPRHDRIEFVAQIETKLREFAEANPPLAAEPGEARPDHSDRFDDVVEAAACSAGVRRPALARRTFSRRRTRSRLAVSSGVLGMVALALLAALPIVYFIVSMLDESGSATVWLIGGHVTALAMGGLLAVALGIAALVVLNRHGGRLVGHGWAVTGLCTGPLPVFVGGLVALLMGVQLLAERSSTIGYTAAAPVYSQASGYPAPPTATPPNAGMNPYAGTVPPGPVAASYGDAPSSLSGFAPPAPTTSPPQAFDPNDMLGAGYEPQVSSPEPPSSPAIPSVAPPTPSTSSPQAFDYADPPLSTPATSTSPATRVAPESPPSAPSTAAPPADIGASAGLRTR